MKMINGRLKVQARGKIRGGFVAWTADPQAGVIHCIGEIRVRHWLWGRSLPFRGTYRVNPIDMKTTEYYPGKRIALDDVQLTVCGSFGDDLQALVGITHLHHPELRGQAILSLAGKHVQLRSLSIQGEALGEPIDFYAR